MEEKLICVLCGAPWGVENPFANRCENLECNGFCTWGKQLNKPDSFILDEEGRWFFKKPPEN